MSATELAAVITVCATAIVIALVWAAVKTGGKTTTDSPKEH